MISQLEVSVEVVDGLRKDTGDVDRINSPQMIAMLEFNISKQLLNNALAIIKVAVNRQVEHVGVIYSSHLQLLHLTNLSMRMQDTDSNAFLTTYSLDSGSARIA
ncbi:hypothetical protein D3C80_1368050 [compost metagenome]